jgi:hypothetical protein
MTLVAMPHQRQVQNLQPLARSQTNRQLLQQQNLQPHQHQHQQSQTAARQLQQQEKRFLQAVAALQALPLHPARRVQLLQGMLPLQLLPQVAQTALQQQKSLRRRKKGMQPSPAQAQQQVMHQQPVPAAAAAAAVMISKQGQ